MPTSHAQTQMQPGVSDSQTIFATASTRRYLSDLIKMSASLCHDCYLNGNAHRTNSAQAGSADILSASRFVATQAAGKMPALPA